MAFENSIKEVIILSNLKGFSSYYNDTIYENTITKNLKHK